MSAPERPITWSRVWNSPTLNTWASFASRFLSLLLVLPLALRFLDANEVALWQLFINVLLIAAILDFGLSPTISRLYALAAAGQPLGARHVAGSLAPAALVPEASRPMQVHSLLRTARTGYALLVVASVLLVGGFGTWAVARPVAAVADPQHAWIAWGVIVVSAALCVWNLFYSSFLLGMNQVALLRRWEAFTAMLQVFTVAAVLTAGGGLLAVVVANQFWLAVALLRNAMLCRRSGGAHWARGWAPLRITPLVRAVWQPMWRSGIGTLFSSGVIYTSGFVMAQWTGGAQLAALLLAQRLMLALSQFSQAPFYSKLPHFTSLYARGALPQLLAEGRRAMFMSHVAIALGVTTIGLLLPLALPSIGSSVAWVSPGLWLVYAAAVFVERAGAMHMQLYSLSNHIIWHIANGLTGVALLVQLWLYQPLMGILAFPVSMLTSYACIYTVIAMARSRRLYQLNLPQFEWRASFWPATLSLGILAAASLL